MIFYAIRHKPTDGYLPQSQGSCRATTFVEPAPLTEASPRLWRTENGARAALRAWLKGRWRTNRSRGEVEIKPSALRKPEEMEVIAFKLRPYL